MAIVSGVGWGFGKLTGIEAAGSWDPAALLLAGLYVTKSAYSGHLARLEEMHWRGLVIIAMIGGALVAGLFLKEFAGTKPWAHIDLGMSAISETERGVVVKGATGFGVRVLLDTLANW